jgi:peptidoglycan DL-endopeptidase LytF
VAKPASRRTLAHYGAPAAFLLAATILAILIHSALGNGHSAPGRTTTTLGPVTRPSTAKVPTQKTRTITNAQTSSTGTTAVAGAQYATVQTGDTYGSIAERYTTSVSELEALNPGVSSNSLQVGQRIRVK